VSLLIFSLTVIIKTDWPTLYWWRR